MGPRLFTQNSDFHQSIKLRFCCSYYPKTSGVKHQAIMKYLMGHAGRAALQVKGVKKKLMRSVEPKMSPLLMCHELPEYGTDNLDSVRHAFQRADGCALGQGWLAKPEEVFTPATVCVGWRENSLRLFAEMVDLNIFTRATSHNQRMWELGSVLALPSWHMTRNGDFRSAATLIPMKGRSR